MQDLFQEGAQNTETPFTPVLLHTSDTMIIVSKANQVEKRFVTQLLVLGTREVSTHQLMNICKYFYFELIVLCARDRWPNKRQRK